MQTQLPCECGATVAVHAGQAGSRVSCACGREVVVPSLSELRRMAGAVSPVSPQLAIQAMVQAGDLPATDDCAICGAATPHVVDIVARCEQAPERGMGVIGQTALIVLFGWIGAWLVVFSGERHKVGSDRDALLPVRLCRHCQRRRTRARPSWPILFLGAIVLGVAIAVGISFEQPAVPFLSLVPVLLAMGIAIHWLHRKLQANLRKLVRTEPLYYRLLDQYPDARFEVAGVREQILKRGSG